MFTLLVTMVRIDEVRELEWKLPRLCLNICWRAKSSARGPGEALLGGGACDPLIPPSIISHLRKRMPVRLRSIHRPQPQIRDRTDDWCGFQLTTCAEGCARSRTPGFSSCREKQDDDEAKGALSDRGTSLCPRVFEMLMMGDVLHVLRWQIPAEKHAKRWRPATAASSLTSINLASDSGSLPRNWHKWYSGLLVDALWFAAPSSSPPVSPWPPNMAVVRLADDERQNDAYQVERAQTVSSLSPSFRELQGLDAPCWPNGSSDLRRSASTEELTLSLASAATGRWNLLSVRRIGLTSDTSQVL